MSAQPAVKTRLIDTIGGLHLSVSLSGILHVTIPGTSKPLGSTCRATDGTREWFAWRAGTDPIRVPSRAAAIEYITSAADAA